MYCHCLTVYIILFMSIIVLLLCTLQFVGYWLATKSLNLNNTKWNGGDVRSWIVHWTPILCSLFHFCPNYLARLPHCGFKMYTLAACSPCTWKCVPLVDLLNGLLWARWNGLHATYTHYFALGMQFIPPAPQSPFSLYSAVNKLHSPDRTAFAFWAHMLLHLGNVTIIYYAAHIIQ